MASDLQHPMPLRSPESPTVDLRHPTPDLQSLQGAYVGNIERLEEHAERMSEAGSDLGEEIRKLQLEQKLSDSRRSSLRSIQAAEEPTRHLGSRSRGASTSSYSNSIVDVNGNARWGGYSPSGFVTSPVGSLRSGSFSQPPTALQRQRSGSRASRLGQVVHPESVEEEQQQQQHKRVSSQSTAGGVDAVSASGGAERQTSPPPNQRSVSSFTRKYDQMAEEIREELRNSVILEQPLHPMTHNNGDEQHHYGDHRDFPDRPPTAASTDTTHQARTLWQDFDGVHCPDTVPEEPPTPTRDVNVRHSTLMIMEGGADLPPQGVPPPDDGMIFYPAPVPRMLNLPKRLSQMPQASTQARRRTQLLDSMQMDNRKSTQMLSESSDQRQQQETQQQNKPNRKSRQNLSSLPPQLRASAFFDQPAPAQEFAVKGESAEATLDSILEASAKAPVSAFTDHPFAGHVGREVYGKEQKRRTKPLEKSIEPQLQEKLDATKRRSSINLLDTHRNSSGDPLNKLKKRNSSADLNMLTVRATESRMSLGDELDEPDTNARGPDLGDDRTPTARSFDDEIDRHPDDELRDEEEYDEEEEEEPEEQYFGPPTTLLAELQMRKQQQKSRNLTAATAFPNGIHSTLLQLDAVAEVEKRKRLKQKVHLAWEAQPPPDPTEEDSDEDVPLGMLYPGRDGLANKKHGTGAQAANDWDRPIGLIAQRELEDNEPLSKRRTRLLGVEPNRARDLSPGKRQTVLQEHPSQQNLTVPTSTTPQPESEGDDEGETLAQRIRRLKNQQTLDKALGDDVRKSVISMDFASEMMSQLGVPEEEDKDKSKTTPSPNGGEEETLGQRRARLQAEALARGDANPRANRPPLRGSMSMADILSAHPIDNTNQARKVSDEMLTAALPQGSLLYQNAMKKEQSKAERLNQNMRSSSYGHFDKPLLEVDIGKNDDDVPLGAKIQAYKQKMAGPGISNSGPQSTMFNSQSMNNMSNMSLPGQRESFFPQANMGMMGMNNMNGMNGMGMMNNMGMMQPNMMAMNMGMMNMPMQNFQYPQVQGAGAGMGMGGGMRHSSMMNMPMNMQMSGMGGMGGMPMQQNMMMMEPPMDPRQRDQIDRWRQGVMH